MASLASRVKADPYTVLPCPTLAQGSERAEPNGAIVSSFLATKWWAGRDRPVSRRAEKRHDDIVIYNEIVTQTSLDPAEECRANSPAK